MLGLIVVAPMARAEENFGCAAYQEPIIAVQPVFSPERYDNNVDLAGLQNMAGQPNVATAGMREVPIGLTASSLKLDSSFEVTSQPMPHDGTVCARISRFDMRFGFDDTTVFVAREIVPYSCGYHEVVAHERRHMAIDRDIVNYYLPQIQGLIAAELRRIGSVRAVSAEAAEAHLRAAINGYLRSLGANVASVREEQQRAFDSPYEYQRLSSVCNGELASLISRATPAL